MVLNYIGDGGINVGDFHEGLNMAAVMRLPFVLIIENNQFAYSTPVRKQFARRQASQTAAAGYGIPGVTVDGTDVLAVYAACRARGRAGADGGGPTLIESVTMRMHGHSASDDASYVPPALLEEWKKKDPSPGSSRRCWNDGLLTHEVDRGLTRRRSTRTSRRPCARRLEADRYPAGEDARRGGVRVPDGDHDVHRGDLAGPCGRRWKRDPSVFLIGEDIGVYGGAFKATKGSCSTSERTGSSTPPSPRRRSSAPPWAPRSSACGRSRRCSSPTS